MVVRETETTSNSKASSTGGTPVSRTSALPVQGTATEDRPVSVRERRRWRLPKDPFPALSHWLGAILSLAGLVLLLARTAHRPWWEIASFAVYGVTLVQLFTASALAHSFDSTPELEQRYTRFDYVSIFLLIAGSYTPICVV